MDRTDHEAGEQRRTSRHDPANELLEGSDVAGPDADPATKLLSDIGNAGVGRLLHESGGVQRAGGTAEQRLDETVSRSIDERRGRGRPLDEPVRRDMEAALGHDLSGVNVHTDRDAHELNEAVGARAFTTGEDVFFKQGTYDPDSSAGRHLLAHELTHVVQQREGTSGLGDGEVSDPSDPAEVEAEAVGAQVASSERPAAEPAASGAGVQREDDEEELQMSEEPGVQREEDLEEEELQLSTEPGVHRQAEPTVNGPNPRT